MKGYLLCIIGTVLLSSIITAIIPEGKTAKVIKGMAKLVCLLAILAPIPRFLQNWKGEDKNLGKNLSETVISTDESFIKYYCEMRVENVEMQLEEEIQEKFSVSAKADIEWEFENGEIDVDNMCVKQIQVTVAEGTTTDRKNAVYEHLTQNYCSEVLIE